MYGFEGKARRFYHWSLLYWLTKSALVSKYQYWARSWSYATCIHPHL